MRMRRAAAARALRRLATALVVLPAMTLAATAQPAKPLGPPVEEPILTIAGAISVTNRDGAAVFDRAMLAALPTVEFETSTIWTDGPHVYRGAPLRAVLERVGAHGTAVRAVALNDYAATIPLDEVEADAPILAYEIDGAAIAVRDRGPIWILYPFDAEPKWRTEVAYSRSVWQLTRLDVLE